MAGKLIAIIGQTASGKSALGMELARRFNGEIICADSRTIYEHLDIGTAKPSPRDQTEIRHHLIDIVTPDQSYSAHEFQAMAKVAIADIIKRGKLPILVGGTGLYIDAILYDFTFRDKSDPELRAMLNSLTIDELQKRIVQAGLPLPFNARNHRHLVRLLETGAVSPQQRTLRSDTLVIGVQLEPETLQKRIESRTDSMIRDGLLKELMFVVKKYGQDSPGLLSTTYKPFIEYLNGTLSLEEARLQSIKNDMRLAKRQRTWFKRNNGIQWLHDPLDAVEIVTTFLSTKTP